MIHTPHCGLIYCGGNFKSLVSGENNNILPHKEKENTLLNGNQEQAEK